MPNETVREEVEKRALRMFKEYFGFDVPSFPDPRFNFAVHMALSERQKVWEEAAYLFDNFAKQWMNSLPIDQVQSLNCKQYAKAIRAKAAEEL